MITLEINGSKHDVDLPQDTPFFGHCAITSDLPGQSSVVACRYAAPVQCIWTASRYDPV